MPDRYIHGHHPSVLRSHRWRTVENSAAYLLPRLRPGISVLDVGCGPGNLTVGLAQRVAPGPVVGVDSAEAAVALATAGAAAGDEVVRFEVGDVGCLAFPDSSFDLVHAHQLLQHLVDPVGALREMARVCRPGGIVAARDGDYRSFAWYPPEPALDLWLEVYEEVARRSGGEPDGGRHLVSWAHAAGLGDVRASASAWCFSHPDDRRFWGELWADRVLESDFAHHALELGVADGDQLQQMAEGWHRWAAHPDGFFAVPHGEIICRRS
jgi:SAM-dependent methyltransferase